MLENFVVDQIIHCDYIRSKLAWILLSEVPTNHLQLRYSCSYYRGEVLGQAVSCRTVVTRHFLDLTQREHRSSYPSWMEQKMEY